MKTTFGNAFWWMVALISMTACEREIYSLNVTPDSLYLKSAHEHPVLDASVVDVEGEEIAINNVEWHSSDPAVVEIDENGRVSARRSGHAVITAKTKTDEFDIPVTVDLPPEE